MNGDKINAPKGITPTRRDMKKSLSDKLSRYGALAAGVLGTAGVHGQVRYIDVQTDTIRTDTLFTLDLDGDSVNNFAIRSAFDFELGINTFDIIEAVPLFSTHNRIAGNTPMSYPYASKFDLGVDIGPSTQWLPAMSDASMSFARNGDFDYNDYWNGGAVDKFLGLRIRRNDSTHFGWMRLDIDTAGKWFIVKDHAVNLKANQTLNTSYLIGVENYQKMAFIVAQRPGEIWVKADALREKATVEMFDLNGRIVHSGNISPSENISIGTSTLANGVYVLRFYNHHGMVERKVNINQ